MTYKWVTFKGKECRRFAVEFRQGRHLMSPQSTFLSIILILGAAGARGAKLDVECPEEIKTKQSATAVPKGWSAYVEAATAAQIFASLVVASGSAKDGYVPLDAESAPAASDETSYKLAPGAEHVVICQYTGSTVRLVRKIPKEATTCRARFSETIRHVQKATCD